MLHRIVTLLPKPVLLLLILLTACQKDKPTEPVTPAKDLTVIFAPSSGLAGDGYNEFILQGAMDGVAAHPGITLHLAKPDSLEEARVMFEQWKASNGPDKALILCGPGLEPLLENTGVPQGRILLLDSNKTYGNGVSTTRLKRYGGAYLAGAMLKDFHLYLIKGLDGDPIIDELSQGVEDGYAENGGVNCKKIVLSTGYEGLDMADELFRRVVLQDGIDLGDHNTSVLVPICGASQLGAFSVSRNYYYAAVGIGKDYSPCSDCIPFSLILDLGSIVKDYIGRWSRGESWPSHEDFGFSTGHVRIAFNNCFDTNPMFSFNWWSFRLSDWKTVEKQYQDIALEKEVSYAY